MTWDQEWSHSVLQLAIVLIIVSVSFSPLLGISPVGTVAADTECHANTASADLTLDEGEKPYASMDVTLAAQERATIDLYAGFTQLGSKSLQSGLNNDHRSLWEWDDDDETGEVYDEDDGQTLNFGGDCNVDIGTLDIANEKPLEITQVDNANSDLTAEDGTVDVKVEVDNPGEAYNGDNTLTAYVDGNQRDQITGVGVSGYDETTYTMSFTPQDGDDGHPVDIDLSGDFDGGRGSYSRSAPSNALSLNDPPSVPTDDDGAANEVSEDATSDTAVGINVSSTDPDGDTVSYSLTADANGGFKIDSATGNVTVDDASKLDHEAANSHTITVEASDSTDVNTTDFTVAVNDITEQPTFINSGPGSVAEDAAGATAYDVNASVDTTATDSPDTGVSYAFTDGNGDGAFAIDSSTGEITVADASKLNYEGSTSRTVTVEASEGAKTKTQDITLNVNDADEAPTFTSGTSDSLAEDARNGDPVHDVQADVGGNSDEGVEYAFTDGNGDGAYVIDISTGEIFVTDATQLDHEVSSSRTVTVKASEGSQNTTQDITLTVDDVDETPTFINSGPGAVDEDASNGTAAHDVDASVDTTTSDSPDAGVSYTFTSGNGDGAYEIDSSTGKITVADTTELDHEVSSSRTVTVNASEGAKTKTQDITLTVNDADETPTFINSGPGAVDEDASNGTAAHDVNASVDTTTSDSPDAGVSYTFTNGNSDGAYEIDSSTGKITVADTTELDHEVSSSRTVTVEASEGAKTKTQDIILNVNDADETPTFINSGPGAVDEDASNGTAAHDVNASVDTTTSDASDTGVTYAITGGNVDSAFAIDSSTGKVTVNNASAVETELRTNEDITFTVEATEGQQTQTQSVTVDINQVDEVPTFTSGTSASVPEDAFSNFLVQDVQANVGGDPDEDVTYAITGGNSAGLFKIDSASGELKVDDFNALDHEDVASVTLTIEASEGAENDTQDVTIDVTDVDEIPTIFAKSSPTVAEDASSTTQFHDVDATVDDADQTLDTGVTYSIVGGNADDAFAIDSATGELTVDNASAVETELYSDLTITVEAAEGAESDTQDVTVDITQVDEVPKFSSAATGSVAEDASNGSAVHDVQADVGGAADENVSYTFTSGNGDAYEIDSSAGEITVADTTELDHEVSSSRTVTVEASEGAKTNTQDITLSVTDADETPTFINSGSGAVDEDASNGTAAHDVDASVDTTTSDSNDTGVSYTFTNGNGDAYEIDSSTGEITVADTTELDHEASSSRTVTVEASEGSATNTQDITLNVDDVEESPSFTSGTSATVAESDADGNAVHDVEADVGGDADEEVSYTITGGNDDVAENGGGAFTIDTSTGQITISDTADIDASNQSSFSLTVEASEGTATTTQTVTITVTDDVAPTFQPGASTPADGGTAHLPSEALELEFDEDVTVGSGDIRIVDEGDGSSTETVAVSSGSVTVSGSTVTVSPSSNLESDTSYHVEIDGGAIEDAFGNTNSGFSDSTTYNFQTADTAPVFSNGDSTSVTVDEDGSVALTSVLEVTDISVSDTLTWTVTSAPGNGTLAGVDGETEDVSGTNSPHTLSTAPTYAPDPDFAAGGTPDDSFTVHVADVNPGVSDTITVDVTVDPINDAPSIALGNNQAVGNDTTQQAVSDFATGFDPGGGSDERTQQISDFVVTSDDTGLFASQPDIDNDGTLTYTPADGVEGTATVDVQVVDDGGTSNGGTDTSATKTFTITVDNQDPTFNQGRSVSESIAEDTTGRVLDVDADDDTGSTFDTGITYVLSSSVGDDTNFSIDSSTGELTLDSATDFESPSDSDTNGDYELTITATDDDGNSNEQRVTVTITDVEESPSFTSGTSATVAESEAGGSAVHDVQADVGGDDDEGVSYTITGGNDDVAENGGGAFTIDTSTGQITISDTADIDESNQSSFSLTVEASEGSATNTQTVTITVTDDVAPTFNSDSSSPADNTTDHLPSEALELEFDEDVTVGSGDIRVVDEGDGSSTETLDVATSAVSTSGSTVTVSPSSTLESDTSYHVEIDSGAIEDAFGNAYGGFADSTTYSFQTADTAPVFSNGDSTGITVSEDGSVNLTRVLEVLDISVSDTLTWTVTSAPGNGTLAGVDGETEDVSGTNSPHTLSTAPTYAPDPDFAAGGTPDDSFAVKVEDTAPGMSDTITVNVTVDPVNDAPSIDIGSDQSVVNETTQKAVSNFTTGFDPGGGSDERTQQISDFVVTSDDTGLFASQPDIDNDGTLTYTPADGVEGTATVVVRVIDDGGTANGGTDTSAPRRFDITVDNRAPSITNFSVSNPSNWDVRVSFESDEQLGTIDVSIGGAGFATLTRGDFSETDNGDGTYTYEGTYTGFNDGSYTATLNTAEDDNGIGNASGVTDSVSVDTDTGDDGDDGDDGDRDSDDGDDGDRDSDDGDRDSDDGDDGDGDSDDGDDGDTQEPSGETSEDEEFVEASELQEVRVVDVQLVTTPANSVNVTSIITLENPSEQDQSVGARFVIDGEVVEERGVVVPAEARITVTHSEIIDKEGTHEVTSNIAIEGADGNTVRTFDFEVGTVELDEKGTEVSSSSADPPATNDDETSSSSADPPPTPGDATSDDGGLNWVLISSGLVALVAVTGVTLYWRRRTA